MVKEKFLGFQTIKVLSFQQDRLIMQFISICICVNHKQECCSNQYHNKKHHVQEHKKYLGKPLLTMEQNQAKSFATLFKRNTFTTKINPSTQEGAQTLELQRPREVCTFPKEMYLLKFSNSHEGYDFTMGNLSLLILELRYQQKCLLAQHGRPL